jgi:hypothetical protein
LLFKFDVPDLPNLPNLPFPALPAFSPFRISESSALTLKCTLLFEQIRELLAAAVNPIELDSLRGIRDFERSIGYLLQLEKHLEPFVARCAAIPKVRFGEGAF